MKKKSLIFILVLTFILIIMLIFNYIINNVSFHKVDVSVYDPQKAVDYAIRYAEYRNPAFPSFESNCVNFVSQCLLAGGFKMDDFPMNPVEKTTIKSTTNKFFCYNFDTNPYKPVSYYVSSSFVRYPDIVKYWKRVANVPYYLMENNKENREKIRQDIKVGDIMFFHSDSFNHASIVSKVDDKDIYYTSNSNNKINYPASLVPEKQYKKISYMKFVK